MLDKLSQFWQELKRRGVPKTLAIYSGTAFIILEAVDIIFPRWGLPDWTIDLVLYLLILGVFITVAVSWIYDITPGGIKKTESQVNLHDFQPTSRNRQIFSNIIIGILMIVIGVLVYPKIFKKSSAILSASGRNIVAVMPLKILGNEINEAYFAAGLTEAITHMLTKAGNAQSAFSVIPASEITESITAEEARKQYGASLIFSGSIQMDEQKTRLIISLIDTKNSQSLRSEMLDYYEKSDLMIQDEAVNLALSMLDIDAGTELTDRKEKGESSFTQANKLYLQAMGALRNSQSLKGVEISIDLFEDAIKVDSLFAKAYAGLGDALWTKYWYTKEPEIAQKSISTINQALHLNKNDPDALYSLADIYIFRKEFDKAYYYLQSAFEEDDPNSLSRYFLLGNYYFEKGEFTKAEEVYVEAVKLKPDDYLSYSRLGSHYYFNGQFNKAIEQYKKGLQLVPENQWLLMNLAGCYFQLDRLSEAIEIFEKILKINPQNTEALLNLGTAYFFEGMFSEAAEIYEQAIIIYPSAYRYRFWLAEAYKMIGETVKADSLSRIAIGYAMKDLEVNPEANKDIAIAYADLGMIDSASSYLEDYLIGTNKNDDPDLFATNDAFNIAGIYYKMGNKQEAILWLESALKRDFGWVQLKDGKAFKELRQDSSFQALLRKYPPPEIDQ